VPFSSRVLQAAVVPCAAQDESPAAAEQSARWVSRKINFTYLGILTRYSCDSLAERMRQLLRVLGARQEDLNIHATGCSGVAGQNEHFPDGRVAAGRCNDRWFRLRVAAAGGSQSVAAVQGAQCALQQQLPGAGSDRRGALAAVDGRGSGAPIAKIPALAHLVGRGALQGAGTASISFGIRFRPHALGGQRSVVEHVRLIGV
jgi:hypothetical protein